MTIHHNDGYRIMRYLLDRCNSRMLSELRFPFNVAYSEVVAKDQVYYWEGTFLVGNWYHFLYSCFSLKEATEMAIIHANAVVNKTTEYKIKNALLVMHAMDSIERYIVGDDEDLPGISRQVMKLKLQDNWFGDSGTAWRWAQLLANTMMPEPKYLRGLWRAEPTNKAYRFDQATQRWVWEYVNT